MLTQDIISILLLLSLPLEIWYMDAYPGVGACLGHCGITIKIMIMVRLKHGLMCALHAHALIFKKYTEGHALAYIQYVTLN